MNYTPRFIVSFAKYKKEVFLIMSQKAVDGTNKNPDFEDCPVTWTDFSTAVKAMNDASIAAVPGNQAGLDVFRPLRLKVEDYLRQMAQWAQPRIGSNAARREASGLPLSQAPAPIPQNLEAPKNATAKPGDVEGEAKIYATPNKSAKGILIELRQEDGTFKEFIRASGFRYTFTGYPSGTVLIVRVRYWNNKGTGPSFRTDLAVVVK